MVRARILFLSLLLPLAATSLAHAADSSSYDLADPKSTTALLAELGAPNYARRQAAQKQLDAIPFTQIDALRKLATQTTDPEIRARLAIRIDAMEPEAALNPPPITLDVENASLSDLAAALAKAMAVPVDLADRVNGTARFTLHEKNRPFWEVIDDLRQQNPISVISTPGQPALPWDYLSLSNLRGAKSQSPDHAAGIRLLMGVAYAGLGTPALKLTIEVDPRVKATLSAKIDSVTDNLGHEKRLQTLADTNPPYYAWKWDEPPEANRLIKSLSVTGTLAMTLTLHEEQVVVDHPQTRHNESIAVGGRYGKIGGFALSAPGPDGKRTLKIAVGLGAPPARAAAIVPRVRAIPLGPLGEDDGVRFDVVDGTGKVLWTGNHSKVMELAYTPGTVTAVIQEPIKLILSTPVTKDLTIPFEFKDLPMK